MDSAVIPDTEQRPSATMARRVYPNLDAYFRENKDERLTAHARDLGVSPGTLSSIRHRYRRPGLELGLAISARFNIPLESLVPPRRKRAS